MKKIAVLWVFLLFVLASCAQTEKRVVEEGPADHPHFRSNMKVIGNYHAQMTVEHNAGKIYLSIYDVNEKPEKIDASLIKAVMTLTDGSEKKLEFYPEVSAYDERKYKQGRQLLGLADTYAYSGDWLRNVHHFTIGFTIPIKNDLYKVNFAYDIEETESSHHRHN